MADITWSPWALANFTEEQRAAAANVVPPEVEEIYRIGTGTSTSGRTPVVNTGTVDPQQMFADGFVYIGGKWVRSQGPELDAALASSSVTSGTAKPTGASYQSQSTFGGGSVLGYSVPAAPAVLLPTWVGGRIGVVRAPGGLRPASGGTPRVVKGRRYPWNNVVRG